MNTANLQLEGLCLAIAAINAALVKKGILTTSEIDGALAGADAIATSDRSDAISSANRDAVRFPVRLLQLANNAGPEKAALSFSDLARMVGEHPNH